MNHSKRQKYIFLKIDSMLNFGWTDFDYNSVDEECFRKAILRRHNDLNCKREGEIAFAATLGNCEQLSIFFVSLHNGERREAACSVGVISHVGVDCTGCLFRRVSRIVFPNWWGSPTLPDMDIWETSASSLTIGQNSSLDCALSLANDMTHEGTERGINALVFQD